MRGKAGFRLAARALIIQENRLLFVSNDGDYWYLPGGRIEGNENLTECVEREVYEETGLQVKTGKLLHVLECFDLKDELHKINFYFQTTLVQGNLSEDWRDQGDGLVQFRRYFSLPEIEKNSAILPRFLALGDWCAPHPELSNVYQGCVTMRGFEMIERDCVETPV